MPKVVESCALLEPIPQAQNGKPVLGQRWLDLCFLHFPVEPELLQARVHPLLEIDTFPDSKGSRAAWLGLVAFRIEDSRFTGLPRIPWLGSFPELNVRTYVRGPDGEPSVLFFSLDAPRRITCAVGAAKFGVPYRLSNTSLRRNGSQIRFRSCRSGPQPASTLILAESGDRLAQPVPDSLEFFLVERYRYFSLQGNSLWTGTVRHESYRLHELRVCEFQSNHCSALGLPQMPIEHACYCSGVTSQFYRPQRLT